MNPSVPAPRGALLLFGGGAVAAVASFMPWARMPVLSVKGISTAWGVATLVAGVLATAIGYRIVRGHRAGRPTRALAIAAAVTAVMIPVVVAGEVHGSLVEERLDAHLQPHGLSAADVLGTDGHPSLFDRFAPFLSGDAAELVAAVEDSMTIRTDVGLWITLAGGIAMSAGALATAARRQRHVSAAPEPGVMTTNAITVSGMTCGGCARRVRRAIGDLPGVATVDVELATGSVTITSDSDLDETSLRHAVETAGYGVAS